MAVLLGHFSPRLRRCLGAALAHLTILALRHPLLPLLLPDTAAPAHAALHTYAAGVVGHEYFHNWTGNRVTCRDWFQLTLKEGLTVYRDQVRYGAVRGRGSTVRYGTVLGTW